MATTEEIRSGLANIVHEVVGVAPEEVQHARTLVDDLGIDSLSMVEVVVAAEQRFGVAIPDAEVRTLRTVAEVVALLQRLGA